MLRGVGERERGTTHPVVRCAVVPSALLTHGSHVAHPHTQERMATLQRVIELGRMIRERNNISLKTPVKEARVYICIYVSVCVRVYIYMCVYI